MVIIDHALLESSIAALAEEERFFLIIERAMHKRTVSDPMRKYYFAVVMHYIAQETGHSADFIHEEMKEKILGFTVDEFGFRLVPSVFSDGSGMDVGAKWDFIDEVRRWAFDFLNLVIPDPETVIL
jgi:hypothetical protein